MSEIGENKKYDTSLSPSRTGDVIVPVNVEPALPQPIFDKWKALRKFSRKVLNAKKWEKRVKPNKTEENANQKNSLPKNTSQINDDDDDDGENSESSESENEEENAEKLKKKAKLDGPKILKLVIPAFFAIIGIVKIIIGSIYIDQCSMENKIPIWLIVSGVVAIVILIMFWADTLGSYFMKKAGKKMSPNVSACTELMIYIILLFYFAWFICGNSWVFNSRSKVQYTDTTITTTYCHSTCYLFSFGIIITFWIIAALVIIFITFLLAISCFTK